MYPLFKVFLNEYKANQNIANVFQNGFINEGVEVTKLTTILKDRWNTQNCSLVNSCTSAITLALRLSGATHGKNVITTPMTCVATNMPIITSGASLVWADIDPLTGMLDPDSVRNKINSDTVAVVVVAWAGSPPYLRELRNICDEYGIKLILDAAHAFDAKYEGSSLHELPDYTCYSFQAIKHFTTGDGGALICRSTSDHTLVSSLKWFGIDRNLAKDEKGDWKGQQWDVDIYEAGYKFNMNNVAAAIGLANIDSIEKNVEIHRHNSSIYDRLFMHNKKIIQLEKSGNNSSHWVYTLRLHDSINRDEILQKLNTDGIKAGVVHVPNDVYSVFKNYETHLPGVREFERSQFSLPCGWWLNDNDILKIATTLESLI